MVVALLGIGGLLGWLGGSLSADPADGPAQPTTAAERTSLSGEPVTDLAMTVRWDEALEVPAILPGWEISDHSQIAEVGCRSYMVVQLRESESSKEINELWSSEDGLTWISKPLDIGSPIGAPRLSAMADGLLLTARTGSDDTLWRATPACATDGFSWNHVPLGVPAALDNQVLTTAVATDGDVVAVVVGDIDIWQEIVTPFLQPTVDLDGDSFRYEGDEFLYGNDGSADIRLFSERPEVVIADQRVWVRLVTLDGAEAVTTVSLPDGVQSTSSNPLLTNIEVFAAWTSSDGATFLPVLEPSVLPRGPFRPASWGDSFVAAGCEMDAPTSTDASAVLWTSDSGTEWLPDAMQPPPECTPFTIAVSGLNIHLTADTGIQCQRAFESEWVVLDEPCTACYKLGGTAGFLGYPTDFQYDRAVLSRDGASWSEISVPAIEPYPTLAVLGDHLLAVSLLDQASSQSSQIRIWLGTIET